MSIQFKLAPSDSYKTKVQVVFRGDFGKRVTLDVKAEFKRLPHSELKRLGEQLGNTDNESEDLDAQLIRDNLIGWETFKDFGGNEVEFSEDAMEAVLGETAFRRAFVKSFLESLSDPEGNNRKN